MEKLKKIIQSPPRTLLEIMIFKASRLWKRNTFKLRYPFRRTLSFLWLKVWNRGDDFKPTLRFFTLTGQDKERRREQYGKLFPAAESKVLARAKNALEHRIDLLGSGPLDLG